MSENTPVLAVSGLCAGYRSTVISDITFSLRPGEILCVAGESGCGKSTLLKALMGVEDATEIRRLLGYREDTAGGMMTTQFVALSEKDTVGDAIEVLRGLDEDFPTVHFVYVLDDESDKLIGVMSLRTLVLAQNDTPLGDAMFTEIITCLPDADEEEVAEDISKYNLLAMPVVDEKGRMLGIVTVDDALDVLEEEHEEDLQIAGGSHTSKSDEASDHLLGRVFSN